jgi:15-cis-phytoene synthase
MNVGTSYANCERLARSAAANFYPAFLVLPREKRRGMYALYAFNRLTDDISDGPGKVGTKRQALDVWQRTLDFVLDHGADHPMLTALRDTMSRFSIPREHFHAVIEGCRIDLEPRQYVTFGELHQYCRLVASAVGQACIHIWGFRGDRALQYADAAGVALQLTNILRDLDEDRKRGRVYLPIEDLDRFGCDRDAICSDPTCEAFQSLMRFECGRAKMYYNQAMGLSECLDPAGRAVFGVMLGTYRRLLERIEESRFDVFSRRVSVPRREKLGLVMRALPVRWGWTRG